MNIIHRRFVEVLLLIWITDAARVGDTCQVARSGARGICTAIDECAEVIDDIEKRNLYPTICGSVGRKQIVCCPAAIVVTTTTTPAPTRISMKKCREYERAKYEKVWTQSGFNERPQLVEKLHCATANVPLIVGGEEAVPGEFPHMALIGYDVFGRTEWNCGGSLISEQYILSAAHCVVIPSYQGVPKYVRLGEHDLANDDRDRPLQVDIANIVPHPNYNRRYKYYDIALIRMALRVSFNRYMRPACLPESYNTNKEHILASGWGKTYFNQGAAQVLMKVVLEVFTEPECNSSYVNEKRLSQLNQGILPDQQFCAGSHREIKDTCGGDSGGPVQEYHPYIDCMYTINGVTSFGKQCGALNDPGIYTRTYTFLDWIESVVWPDEQI